MTDQHREAARAVLQALQSDGRLLPPGGITRTEYGIDFKDYDMVITRTGAGVIPAGSTHQRRHTVWFDEGPNDRWTRYITAWEKMNP